MKWRFTDRVQKQMDAFLKVHVRKSVHILHVWETPSLPLFHLPSPSLSQGFSDLIPLPLIKVFDERELEVSNCVMS